MITGNWCRQRPRADLHQFPLDQPCRCFPAFRVTTPARTGFDLGRELPREQAVPILDALCAAAGLDPQHIEDVARVHPGTRGVTRLSAILQLIDAGAESPPESHTRRLLIDQKEPDGAGEWTCTGWVT